jgi:hypothetical protein
MPSGGKQYTVGLSVGVNVVGKLVGLAVGVEDVGDLLGLAVGFEDVGNLLGLAVGFGDVGALVGRLVVGAALGLSVGPAVGFLASLLAVGFLVETAVGEPVAIALRRHLPWLQIVTRPLLFTYWQQSKSWIQALLTSTHVLVLPLGLAVATAPRVGPG